MSRLKLVLLRTTTYIGILTATCAIWYFLIKFLLTMFKGD